MLWWSKMIANIIIRGALAVVFSLFFLSNILISSKKTKSFLEPALISVVISLICGVIQAPLLGNLPEAAKNFVEDQIDGLSENIDQIISESDNSPIPDAFIDLITADDTIPDDFIDLITVDDTIPSSVTNNDNDTVPSSVTNNDND